MNTLQPGQFYKTCAAFPVDLKGVSPLKIHGLWMEEYHVKRIPIRLCEDTTMWHIPYVKVAKPHSCYLVSYDASTSIGIIFLGSSSPQAYSHRFVKVHSTAESSPLPGNALGTIPPNGFPTSFSLNITHPLRVKLVYVGVGTSLNSLKHGPVPLGPPPHVGITQYMQDIPTTPIRLSLESGDVFWSLHKRYHKYRRGSNLQIDRQGGNNDAQGGNNGVHGSSNDAQGVTPIDAPWGKIGGFRVVIDIPLIIEEMDSDVEYSDKEVEENSDVVEGIVYVQDFDSPIIVCV